MSKNTFVLSDETINDRGFIVKTSGIDLERFLKNPVMLYAHKTENGCIGKWENIRIDKDKLIADAVFYEDDELSVNVKNKMEKGFLNACSIGFDVIEMQQINGVDVVTKCELYECSICDIPSNKNAVKLYYNRRQIKNYSDYLKLAVSNKNDFFEQVCEKLGVPPTTSENEVLKVIAELVGKSNSEEVENALKTGLVNSVERGYIIRLSKEDNKAFKSLINTRKAIQTEQIKTMTLQAFNEGKLDERELFNEIGQNLGVTQYGRLLACLNKRISLTALLKDKTQHTHTDLEYYRRNDPETLRQNPQLYKTLIEREKIKNQ